jgi:hypothetical protein
MIQHAQYHEDWKGDNTAAVKHCDYCGSPIDRKGDAITGDGRRDATVFKSLAWHFRRDPVRTMVMLYRVTDQDMTLQDIADAITSVVATVHNRRPYMTRQAVMDQVRRICDASGDGSIVDILMPRRKGKR